MTRSVLRRYQDGLPTPSPQEYSQVTPPPCDCCACAVACRHRHLACRAFAQYIKTGRWKVLITRRLPSGRSYQRLFRG